MLYGLPHLFRLDIAEARYPNPLAVRPRLNALRALRDPGFLSAMFQIYDSNFDGEKFRDLSHRAHEQVLQAALQSALLDLVQVAFSSQQFHLRQGLNHEILRCCAPAAPAKR